MRNRIALAMGVIASLACTSIPHGAKTAPAAPIWEREVVAFSLIDPPDARPWRRDPRLVKRFHAQAADDVQVEFATRVSPRAEVMWVTVLGFDAASDTFLGQLLNTPYHVKDLFEGDNVAFHIEPGKTWPVAMDDGRGYGAHGLPRQPDAFVSAVAEGLRAYRQGRFGHVQSGIRRCIDVLRAALRVEPPDASVHDRQLAHFVLGRCLAERYDTREAITHFERAIELDRSDPHAQMCLIAELSVMANSPENQAPEGGIYWDERLGREMANMRKTFPKETRAIQMLSVITDRKYAKPGMSPEELERGDRLGFATLRYKAR